MDGERSCLSEWPKASSSSVAPQPTKSPRTHGPSNHAEAWIQMRPASPTSLKNEAVTPIKPAGQSALDVQSATPAAVTKMDFSSPSGQCRETSSIQQQPAVAPRLPAFPDAPTIQNEKTVPQPDCRPSNVAQITFQPLQAPTSIRYYIPNSKSRFHSAALRIALFQDKKRLSHSQQRHLQTLFLRSVTYESIFLSLLTIV